MKKLDLFSRIERATYWTIVGTVVLGAAPAGYYVSLLFLPGAWPLSARILVAAGIGVATLFATLVPALLIFGIAETAFTGIRKLIGLRPLPEIEAAVMEAQ